MVANIDILSRNFSLPAGLQVGYKGHIIATLATTICFKPGEFTMVVGRNGAGKTTLLKTIAGITPPLRHTLQRPGRFVYVSNDLQFPEKATPREIGRSLRLERCSAATKVAEVLSIALDTPFKRLSFGNRQKIRIWVGESFGWRNTGICFDEPLSGLDCDSREALLQYWNETRTGPHRIVAMHPEHGMPEVSDQILSVKDSEVVEVPKHFKGPELRPFI